MAYEIVVTGTAEQDLASHPETVVETFLSKIDEIEKNLHIGAEPGQAFDKYLSGNMHPVLQMNPGRDHRAWFIEGVYVGGLDDDRIYAWRILTKKEAKKLTGKIVDPIVFCEPGTL